VGGNATGPADLLVLATGHLLYLFCCIVELIRFAKFLPVLLFGKALDSKSALNRIQIRQIPTLQFVAGDPHQSIWMSSSLALLHKIVLHRVAVSGVLIAKDDKFGPRNEISPHAARHLLFEILLAFEDDIPPHHIVRQDLGEKTLQHGLLGRAFKEKDDLVHAGPTPSKKPCFQR